MVAEVAAANDLSTATVHRYLRRYWEGGQNPDALWPDEMATQASARATANRRARRGVLQDEPDVRNNFRMAVTRKT